MSTFTPEKLGAPALSTAESGFDESLEASLSAEIREIVPNSASENSTGATGKATSAQTQAKHDAKAKAYKAKVAKLKAATPPTKLLIKEIRANIFTKLKDLNLEKQKAIKSGGRGFSKYNDVIAQMRSLRKIASSLLYRTYEDLKIIWLKIVHDIV